MKIEICLALLFLLISAYWHNADYSDSLDFQFKSFGDPTRPTIVIIPGLDGVTAFFSDVIPELTVHYHVFLYYLPLKTKSLPPQAYTFDYIANDLNSLLVNNNISNIAAVVGESFGGIVTQHFALNFPQKLASMILLSSLAKTDLPAEIEFKFHYLLPVVKFLGQYFPKFGQILFAHVHADDVVEASEPPYVRDLFVREASVAHFPSVMARIQIAYELDIVDRVKSLQLPTLLVYGRDDHFTKKDTLFLSALIAGSEVLELPGGHLAHVSAPKPFAQGIISFLELHDDSKK